MENILKEPVSNYLKAKTTPFAGNNLAHKFRHDYPKQINELLLDKIRYKTVGSTGKGNWTDCPWIAILDTLITDTPQKGYYPVFIFKSDMSGVYLSLNQGVTDVIENYKRKAKEVLLLRAEDYRAKLNFDSSEFILNINLNSRAKNAKHYEAGNILAKFYPKNELPDTIKLKEDLNRFLYLYENLTYSDDSFSVNLKNKHFENKQVRLHLRAERNSSLSKKVKKIKGYSCEVCEMEFSQVYGELGKGFIEAHHLKPISQIGIGKFEIDLENDFAVLCSNCHSMIHRLDDPSDLRKLREIIKKNSKA